MMFLTETTMTARQTSTNSAMARHARARVRARWLCAMAVLCLASEAQAQSPIPPVPGLAPGLYVQVIDGLIHVTNPSGTSNFAAGQFGYTSTTTQPPIIVPKNPGIQFTPPPVFNSSPAPQTTSSGGKSNTVDCEVR
jgi:hypothetical protein